MSGSTRAASSNTAALRACLDVLPEGVEGVLYNGMAELPAFNPDDDQDAVSVPAPVARLREEISAADVVLLSTPEYAGTLPGSFKNLLDWTVGGGVLYGKPVGILHVAAPGRGEGAQATLGTVLGYVGAVIPDALRFRIPVLRQSVDEDGAINAAEVGDQLQSAVARLVDHVRQGQAV